MGHPKIIQSNGSIHKDELPFLNLNSDETKKNTTNTIVFYVNGKEVDILL